ncbi:helix-turn-helix domain-containing protein [Streptomyces sp. NPDC091682]|uniref:helix-turn-helix domain-containing protein n=1 Tax=Streptomyces sp. NPDC091682 TaxID=3366005 RepID=UPI0038067FE5
MGTLFTLLNSRGVSTRKLAAAVDVSQGRLYDYTNGNCRVEKLSVFEQIADGLGIPGHLLGLARRPWEPLPKPSAPAISDLPADTGDLEAIDAFRDRTAESVAAVSTRL